MSGISLTEREALVARAYFSRYKPQTVSSSDWETIAAEANITNGNVVRNAQHAFGQMVKKLSGGSAGEAHKSPSAACAKSPKGITKTTPKKTSKALKAAVAASDLKDHAGDSCVDIKDEDAGEY